MSRLIWSPSALQDVQRLHRFLADKNLMLPAGSSDEGAQLVYGAAILDETGYEDAHELKIRQLQQRLFDIGAGEKVDSSDFLQLNLID